MSKSSKKNAYVCKPAIRIPAASDEAKKVFDLESDANWRIFRIMSEFVQGWQFLAELNREICFFGSSRTPTKDKYYKLAENLAFRLGKAGYTVVTRGGYGIMEAANKGAYKAGAESVGINLLYPGGTNQNKFVKKKIMFAHYFTQKVIMNAAGQAYIFFPGGYGTLDSFYEFVTLIQTKKMEAVPIILVGKNYWQPVIDYIKEILLKKYRAICQDDLNIFNFVGDDIDQAYKIILKTKEREIF